MHEFSICEALVDAVLLELRKLPPPAPRLKRAHVAIGDMRQIVPDTLIFAYQTLIRDTPADGSELNIRAVPVTARCTACQWQGNVEDHIFICPRCQTALSDILTGKELVLETLEIDDYE